ncbi:MAG: hypothetical protein AAGD09_11520 [Cyanobacteria bacterium P01_F01_bin.56]
MIEFIRDCWMWMQIIWALVLAISLYPITKLIYRFDKQLAGNPATKKLAETYLNWLGNLLPTRHYEKQEQKLRQARQEWIEYLTGEEVTGD